MQELLLSDEFSRYRKALLEAIVSHIDLFTASDLKETKGALDMARKIIQLPEKIVTGKKTKALVRQKVQEDIKDFQVRFIRSHIIED